MQDNNPAYESARNPNQIEDYDYMWSHYMGQKRPSVRFPSVPHLSSLHIRKPFDMTLLELIRPICKFKNILFSSCFVCRFILCSSCYNWMWNICLELSTPSHSSNFSIFKWDLSLMNALHMFFYGSSALAWLSQVPQLTLTRRGLAKNQIKFSSLVEHLNENIFYCSVQQPLS